MGFNASDYLSTAALVVSFASAYYTKKQSDSSRIASTNDYRAHLSDKHDKYRTALKQVNDKHKEDIAYLSQEAGNALQIIVEIFDQYDTHNHETRYLRHLVHECSEMVYYAFKGQLGWQTGLNISHRFFQMTHLEDRVEPHLNYFNQDEFRVFFESRYFNNQNAFQETKLLKDTYFCSLVNQIKQRIDSTRRGELLLEIQEVCRPFNSSFKDLKPKISESANYLQETLEESDLEHFPLHESPELYRRLKYKKATLDTLSNLRLQEIDRNNADRFYNYVSLSIYTCAILHAIQGFYSWGWNRQDKL
ncbi:hypothetical protein [Geobacter argillaceus]|uniref:Uncharacterized protein n=1 Tax=Geobacter argillaceus TaxID=345631 RepID=A0A562V5I8_9BACT|nr:hypothetical protein [Geobacter argillaceus]TWJ13184.1 hypothetical protein JN12_03961 [Geobacter argillaceus]